MLKWCGGMGTPRPNHCKYSPLVHMDCGMVAKHYILIPWWGWVLLLGRWCDGRRCLTMLCSDWCARRAVLCCMWCVQSSCCVDGSVHAVLVCYKRRRTHAAVAGSDDVQVLRVLRSTDVRVLRAVDLARQPTLCLLATNARPRHWVHGRRAWQSLCGRICARWCRNRWQCPFPQSQMSTPRRWETIGGTYLYYVEGMPVGWKDGRWTLLAHDVHCIAYQWPWWPRLNIGGTRMEHWCVGPTP